MAGTTILSYLSPWKVQHRFVPFLMFLVALLVLRMPEWIDVALMLTIPAAMLSRWLGIEHSAHEPVKIRLPKLRKPRIMLQDFVTRAYPDPAAEPEGAEDDEPPVLEAGDTITQIPKFVPEL